MTVRAGIAALLAVGTLGAASCGGQSSAQERAAGTDLAGAGTGGTGAGAAARMRHARPVTGPTLVAAGDIACPPGEPRTRYTCHQRDTARLLARLDPDVVAPLGDLQYPAGALADFQGSFDRSWGRLKARMRPAVGNHEYGTPGAAGYVAYFGQRAGPAGRGWYAYGLGSWRIVVLNANCDVVGCGPGSRQQRWLRAALTRHPRRCTLAYWHQPRFSSGLHGPDEAVAPLWRTLQRAGADVVLSGHDHDYERFAPQTWDGRRSRARGMVQFVVGGGGKSLYPILLARRNSRARASTFGVLQLTLGPGRYAWRFVGEPGERFRDAGTARCR